MSEPSDPENGLVPVLVELPEGLTPIQLMQLARALAQDLNDPEKILKQHGLTKEQYDLLCKNKFFYRMLTDQVKAWQGIEGTEERLKLQAALALEEQLPTIAGRMGRASEELRDVVEGAKLLAKISGVDAGDKRQGNVGEKFTIHIDLGADSVTISPAKAPLIDVTPEKE